MIAPVRQCLRRGVRLSSSTLAYGRNYSRRFHSQSTQTVTTDEGVVIHTSDPSSSGDGLGLVWGSVLWPSGIALAKYLHYVYINHDRSEDASMIASASSILELGCGTGVVGLTCAKYTKTNAAITLTDSEPALWPLLRQSIQDNDVPNNDKIAIHGLDWRDPTTFLTSSEKHDLVVAADVLYSGMDKLFARALASHIHSMHTIALVASPFRKDSPLKGFLEAAQKLGLQVERLQDENGQAAGAYTGVTASQAYQDTRFVKLQEEWDMVCRNPTFTEVNEKQVQIFRVTRVSGTPEEAASIRRVSRI